MFTRRKNGDIEYYTSTLLEKYSVNHMFCTRYGGVSDGDFGSLNVSTARKDRNGNTDKTSNVAENYKRALGTLGWNAENACAAKQVHSDIILEVTPEHVGKGVDGVSNLPDCDGIILRRESRELGAVCVKTADCVPVLLADSVTGDVCAVHAGWRGSAADIVTKAANKLSHGKPENIVAAIGPCIGRCCYEVGEELYNSFKTLFKLKCSDFDVDSLLVVVPSCSMGGKRYFDLAGANKALLLMMGVKEKNIDKSGMCTCCFKDENGNSPFFSHRASGGYSGTFPSIIGF